MKREKTFAEAQLKPHGFVVVEREPHRITVRRKGVVTTLGCLCLAYPTHKDPTCPLHAEVTGHSPTIARLIEQATLIPVGTKVTTVQVSNPSPNWTAEARARRRFGVHGVVVAIHQSYGLWYSVKHMDDKSIGQYDPHELETPQSDRTLERLLS